VLQQSGKILIVVQNLPVPFDRRVWMEATSLRRAGYDVSVICPKGKGYSEDYTCIDGVHIYRHPLPKEAKSVRGYLNEYWASVLWEFRLARRVWKERGGFDIIHICNPPDLLFLTALWFKLFKGCKVIFDQHDLCPEMYEVKFGKRDVFYWLLICFERLTFFVADVVISTNESYRSIALTRGRKTKDNVFVVRSAPDLSRFKRRAPNLLYKNGRRYLVGYVGVMGEQEGIDYLLRSIKYIVYELGRTDIQFTLIGDGPVRGDLEKLCEHLSIKEYVEFAGRVPDDELLERLSTCDIGVNPDPKNPFNDKSTMNKILEYMAIGLPIVQYDVLEGRRSAGPASLYAKANDEKDFADKIVELLDNPRKRDEMSAVGRSRMKDQLEWSHQVPRLLEAYDRVLSIKNQRRGKAANSLS
jgi:glycosyltransferase involved in cell wall biosynthesis